MQLLGLSITRHRVEVSPALYFFQLSVGGRGREFRETLASAADVATWVRWAKNILSGFSDFMLEDRQVTIPTEVSSTFVEYFPPADEGFLMLAANYSELQPHPRFLPTLLSGPGVDGLRRQFVLWPSETGETQNGKLLVRPVPAENFSACTFEFQEMVDRVLDTGHRCILKLD